MLLVYCLRVSGVCVCLDCVGFGWVFIANCIVGLFWMVLYVVIGLVTLVVFGLGVCFLTWFDWIIWFAFHSCGC